MSAPITAARVVSYLQELAVQLNQVIEKLDKAEVLAVNAREDYTRAYAEAFLRAEGSMEARRQKAILKTQVERLNADLAEQVVRGMRRQVDTIKVRIDVGRSMSAAIRAEAGLAGSGMAP